MALYLWGTHHETFNSSGVITLNEEKRIMEGAWAV